jgi:hypothetical protein
MIPKLSLHGDFLVLTEQLAPGQQAEDQIDLERESYEQAGDCVHFYRAEAGREPSRINSICGRGMWPGLSVSPDGTYVLFPSVIVGRDYRNDGSGPEWLTNGPRP